MLVGLNSTVSIDFLVLVHHSLLNFEMTSNEKETIIILHDSLWLLCVIYTHSVEQPDDMSVLRVLVFERDNIWTAHYVAAKNLFDDLLNRFPF